MTQSPEPHLQELDALRQIVGGIKVGEAARDKFEPLFSKLLDKLRCPLGTILKCNIKQKKQFCTV
jgi:hypothetical protein